MQQDSEQKTWNNQCSASQKISLIIQIKYDVAFYILYLEKLFSFEEIYNILETGDSITLKPTMNYPIW